MYFYIIMIVSNINGTMVADVNLPLLVYFQIIINDPYTHSLAAIFFGFSFLTLQKYTKTFTKLNDKNKL